MNTTIANRALYGLVIVASYGLTAFAVQLGAGKVPIPDEWEWVLPILSAVVTATLTLLPRVGNEGIAAQSDALKARGIPKHEQVLVTKDEAAVALAVAPTPSLAAQIADELEARMRAEPSRG